MQELPLFRANPWQELTVFIRSVKWIVAFTANCRLHDRYDHPRSSAFTKDLRQIDDGDQLSIVVIVVSERLTENELSDFSQLWHGGCGETIIEARMWTEITRRKYEREGQRYASDLTDAEWALIEPHMPAAKRLGRPRATDCAPYVDAILYMARTGCQWRMLQGVHDGTRLFLRLARRRLV